MTHRKIDYLNFDTINSVDTLLDCFDTNFTNLICKNLCNSWFKF